METPYNTSFLQTRNVILTVFFMPLRPKNEYDRMNCRHLWSTLRNTNKMILIKTLYFYEYAGKGREHVHI